MRSCNSVSQSSASPSWSPPPSWRRRPFKTCGSVRSIPSQSWTREIRLQTCTSRRQIKIRPPQTRHFRNTVQLSTISRVHLNLRITIKTLYPCCQTSGPCQRRTTAASEPNHIIEHHSTMLSRCLEVVMACRSPRQRRQPDARRMSEMLSSSLPMSILRTHIRYRRILSQLVSSPSRAEALPTTCSNSMLFSSAPQTYPRIDTNPRHNGYSRAKTKMVSWKRAKRHRKIKVPWRRAIARGTPSTGQERIALSCLLVWALSPQVSSLLYILLLWSQSEAHLLNKSSRKTAASSWTFKSPRKPSYHSKIAIKEIHPPRLHHHLATKRTS